MHPQSLEFILHQTGATRAEPVEQVQSLWSGYGEILRYALDGCKYPTVIVKRIHPPNQRDHPRGWNSDIGHQRKLRSYQVESDWYRHWGQCCDIPTRIARCLGIQSTEQTTTLILEDLDAAGYPLRQDKLSPTQLNACLNWLAHFHARFLGQAPKGLWPIGTYWHLDTRPEEWQAMAAGPLKAAARAIDEYLRHCRYQTIVHGDAKVENFCFSARDNSVAAVDFQYVGGGCGMKDLAYFISSCMGERECEEREQEVLDSYFSALHSALHRYRIAVDYPALEREWRTCYPVAWADFYRFLQGWMPGHWKIHDYSRQMVARTLALLDASPARQS